MTWSLVAVFACLAVGGSVLVAAPAEAQCGQNSNFGACAAGTAMPAAAEVSLYKRLGGREGIGTFVSDFVGNMAADPRVNARFKDMKGADIEKLKSNLADQICDA